MAVNPQITSPQKLAATNSSLFAKVLLMQQFAAQEIGERIRLARKERGLTQEELASMASFSTRSLQDYEKGVTTPYRHLRELSRLLGRKEAWFLYGEEDEFEDPRVLRLLESLEAEVKRLHGLNDEIAAQLAPPQREHSSRERT